MHLNALCCSDKFLIGLEAYFYLVEGYFECFVVSSIGSERNRRPKVMEKFLRNILHLNVH